MNNDDQKVWSFVDKIKEDLLQDIKNEEMEVKRRMEKELELKILADQIYQLKSEYSKSKDILEELQQHKNFLYKIKIP